MTNEGFEKQRKGGKERKVEKKRKEKVGPRAERSYYLT